MTGNIMIGFLMNESDELKIHRATMHAILGDYPMSLLIPRSAIILDLHWEKITNEKPKENPYSQYLAVLAKRHEHDMRELTRKQYA